MGSRTLAARLGLAAFITHGPGGQEAGIIKGRRGPAAAQIGAEEWEECEEGVEERGPEEQEEEVEEAEPDLPDPVKAEEQEGHGLPLGPVSKPPGAAKAGAPGSPKEIKVGGYPEGGGEGSSHLCEVPKIGWRCCPGSSKGACLPSCSSY